MALAKCRECKHKISTEAEVCPSCGIKNPYEPEKIPTLKETLVSLVAGIVGVTGLILGIGLCVSITGGEEKPNTGAKARADKSRSMKERIKDLPGLCTAYIFLTLASDGTTVKHWGKSGAWRKGQYNYASQRITLSNNERFKILCCIDRKSKRSGIWSITDLRTNQTKAMHGKASCRG